MTLLTLLAQRSPSTTPGPGPGPGPTPPPDWMNPLGGLTPFPYPPIPPPS